MSRFFLGAALMAVLTVGYNDTTEALEALKQGDSLGAFTVTKVAGAEEDGVEVGESLCYRCRYGSRPMVIVFTRTPSDQLTAFLKTLDKAVSEHESARLVGFVTLLGTDRNKLEQSASELVKSTSVKQVPITIAEDIEHGPLNYRLSDGNAVTIVVANDNQVVASHASPDGTIDSEKVMASINQVLN